jgi:hypothetical protein
MATYTGAVARTSNAYSHMDDCSHKFYVVCTNSAMVGVLTVLPKGFPCKARAKCHELREPDQDAAETRHFRTFQSRSICYSTVFARNSHQALSHEFMQKELSNHRMVTQSGPFAAG